ncbi:tRNA nucleotidyltransferase (CCA-adding enzyme) [Nannocystis exedens]|uniref:tRNA nucleotidyltransferase (CCA-adding enzyme) n=1 Tax=Nannocystis exedens TaxID=54 RepID=A0A1I1WB34_9BACT|nr:tRNA cytidylyltransferase [Nannocystis exedens]PCC67537.1 [cytidine(C)-cytidine(C)-adenosine (A)]-adding enzyme [Nannocystis exedens]SFD91608.1 tRNA nucleotidyltransferase (CCA-adding enzyme) [Nannocystis exedens]
MIPTPSQAAALLRAAPIPAALREIAQILHDAGHEAVLVGGAVRDVLLGRLHGDWDLASSATPEEVQTLFKKTIPTGVAHGTVTVVHGRGPNKVHAEVTTFRGEGRYEDGRRPAEVRFLRDLREDLARRDFTINAFAWNPIREIFTDCFDGLGDLGRGVIRAVGDPAQRFQEDGLRAMRAVRLCAVLEYRLDLDTAAAIGGALDVLDKVSRERVHVELFKLLAAARPILGLLPMAETGIWPRVLAPLEREEQLAAIEHIERLPRDPVIRLARLLWPLRADKAVIEKVIDNLRPSRDERARVLALTNPALGPLAHTHDPLQIRRILAKLGRKYAADAAALHAGEWAQAVTIEEAIRGAPLAIGELAIRGDDLVREGLATPGPQMGKTLADLLDWTLEDPRRNTRDRLLAHLRGAG